MREVCNPLPAAPLIALLLGQPALASPPPWMKDTRGTDLDAELDQLSPEIRAALLRAAFLRELESSGLGPDTPDLLGRLAAWREADQNERAAEQALQDADLLIEGGDLEGAASALAEAEQLGADPAEVGRRRQRLSVSQLKSTAIDVAQVAVPILLPVLGLLILAALGRRVAPEPPLRTPHLNPYLAGRPIRDPALFYGRDALLRGLLGRLEAGASVFLLGERRIGKTSTLLQLGRAWRERGGSEVFLDLEGSLGRGPMVALRDGLAREAARRGLGAEGDIAELLARLASADQPLLLLLDEVDVFGDADPDELRALVEQVLSAGATVRLAMAGVEPPTVPEALQPLWRERVVELTVPPLDATDSRRLFLEPGAEVLDVDEEVVAEVLRRAQGRPMRLQLFGLHLVDRLGLRGQRRATTADLRAILPAVEHAWSAIQEAGLPERDAPLELDAALYELARLRQEVQLLEREVDRRMRGAP